MLTVVTYSRRLTDGGVLRGYRVVMGCGVPGQQVLRDSRPNWCGYQWAVVFQGRLQWAAGLD